MPTWANEVSAIPWELSLYLWCDKVLNKYSNEFLEREQMGEQI